MKAAFLRPVAEVVRRGGVFRVDATDGGKPVGIGLTYAGGVAVVPPVIDDLYQHRPIDAVGRHLFEQRLRCSLAGRWLARLRCPGVGRVVRPDVNVWIDERHRYPRPM